MKILPTFEEFLTKSPSIRHFYIGENVKIVLDFKTIEGKITAISNDSCVIESIESLKDDSIIGIYPEFEYQLSWKGKVKNNCYYTVIEKENIIKSEIFPNI